MALKKKTVKVISCVIVAAAASASHVMRKNAEREIYTAHAMDALPVRKAGLYEKYAKRAIDVACASAALIVFWPLYLIVTLLVKHKLGSPVLFTQERPGLVGKDGKETVFKMYKFRTMTDECDESGKPLPDEVRLTSFGKKLRATSLDELPEVINLLNGTMSVIGPRPQLVRDMVFMTDEQRKRHTVKPGLSGLAQVKGRNAISWEDKFKWDLKYLENISFKQDLSIVWQTVMKVFIKSGDPDTSKEVDLALDYGDDLLARGCITQDEYDALQRKAAAILERRVY